MKKYNKYAEEQNDIKIGDTVYTGRFKNHKGIVTGLGTDENGQPTIKIGNKEIKLYSVRIAKLLPKKEKLTKYSRD